MYVQLKVHSWLISGILTPSHAGFVTHHTPLSELIKKQVFVNTRFAVESIITAFTVRTGIYSEGSAFI